VPRARAIIIYPLPLTYRRNDITHRRAFFPVATYFETTGYDACVLNGALINCNYSSTWRMGSWLSGRVISRVHW